MTTFLYYDVQQNDLEGAAWNLCSYILPDAQDLSISGADTGFSEGGGG